MALSASLALIPRWCRCLAQRSCMVMAPPGAYTTHGIPGRLCPKGMQPVVLASATHLLVELCLHFQPWHSGLLCPVGMSQVQSHMLVELCLHFQPWHSRTPLSSGHVAYVVWPRPHPWLPWAARGFPGQSVASLTWQPVASHRAASGVQRAVSYFEVASKGSQRLPFGFPGQPVASQGSPWLPWAASGFRRQSLNCGPLATLSVRAHTLWHSLIERLDTP